MARIRSFQTNFSSGEIDEKAQSRFDIEAFQNGAKRVRNYRIMAQGGVTPRPGMNWLTDLTANRTYVAKRFVFDADQAYVFLFSDGQLDIYEEDGTLVQSSGSMKWVSAYLGALYVAQELDTMIVTMEDMETQKIVRDSATSFTISDFAFEEDSNSVPQQPWEKFADSSITLTPSGTTGSINLTTSSDYWEAEHVGTYVRYEGKAVQITSITSATVVVGTCLETLGGTSASTDWDESAFSDVHGWPRTCIFYDGRLWFGGSKTLPTTVFGSRSSAPFNFDVGNGSDGHAIQEAIRDRQVSDIVSMASHRHLQIFTSESEFIVPQSEKEAITPSNVAFKPQSNYGSQLGVEPFQVDGAVHFLTKTGASIRAFSFDDLENAYSAESVTFLAGHLISGVSEIEGQVEAVGQQETYLFALNGDGDVAVFITVEDEDIKGWCLWSTDGSIQSITNVDRKIFAVVNRTIAGSDVTTLEVFDPDYQLDSAEKSTQGSATTSWTGFTRFANATVDVKAGDRYLGQFAVDGSGNITLDTEETAIEVGIKFTPSFTTLRPELQLPRGITIGERRRVVRVVLDLYEALDVTVNGTNLVLRQIGDDVSDPLSQFTGRREIYIAGWDDSGEVTVSQDDPVKCTITGIMVEVEV